MDGKAMNKQMTRQEKVAKENKLENKDEMRGGQEEARWRESRKE